MNEYISREAVLQKFLERGSGYINELTMLYMINEIPAADVQLVKRGEWDFQGYQLFKCTNCKEIFTQNQLEAMQNHIDQEEFAFPNFCPHCGARMIKEGDTE